jgi:hypothetical protein
MLWGGLYARGSANAKHGGHKAHPTLIHTRAKARGYGVEGVESKCSGLTTPCDLASSRPGGSLGKNPGRDVRRS